MIKLIILDVDGCLCPGKFTIDETGHEYKTFNTKDGLGIQSYLKMGGHVAIITGRVSKVVENRAKEMGIEKLIMGSKDKLKDAQDVFTCMDISKEETAYIGDDLNDAKLLQEVAMSFCPSDACESIKKIVDYKLKNRGGEGVIREMIEFILRKEGKFDDFVKRWF